MKNQQLIDAGHYFHPSAVASGHIDAIKKEFFWAIGMGKTALVKALIDNHPSLRVGIKKHLRGLKSQASFLATTKRSKKAIERVLEAQCK